MSNLYQDAILDAKALRASAMANAKAALEEAFQPKIEEMLRLSLSEEIDETEGLEEMEHNMDETIDEMGDTYHEDGMEESADINEAELEEILAQLEELSGSEDHMEETESLNEAEEEEEETEEEDEEEEVEDAEEETGDETKVIDLTLGDLKQVIQSVLGSQQDMGVDAMSDDMPTDDSEAEADISLDEILAELENEGLEEEKHEEKDVNEAEAELEEAKSTIEELRQSLQEVNLLNAKYLYMNKLFKSKSLTESQKVKVVNALDRASSVKEVKNTYETLKESFNSPKKTQLKESIGFASQAAGIAPKQPIIEQDSMLNRWQKLAGIK